MENKNKELTPTETDDTTLLIDVSGSDEETSADLEEKDLSKPEEEEVSESEEEDDMDEQEGERKILFMKAAQGYGMILGFGVGYILSGILSELGFVAGKFECVILCMFAGIAIGYLISNKKPGNKQK